MLTLHCQSDTSSGASQFVCIVCAEGGEALSNIIFGDTCPSGRLPFPYTLAGGMTLPFGFGLSFTTFEYSGLDVSALGGSSDESHVTVSVRNTGTAGGQDAVLVFTRCSCDYEGSYRLAGFGKTALLSPGEVCPVTIDFRSKCPNAHCAARWIAQDVRRGCYLSFAHTPQ